MSYIGAQPKYARLETDTFNADGFTDTFTLTFAPGVPEGILVLVENVFQEPRASYIVSGKNLIFDEFPIGRVVVMYRGIEGSAVVDSAVNITGDHPLLGSPTRLDTIIGDLGRRIGGIVVASKAEAVALMDAAGVIDGLKVFITSSDGGPFIMRSGGVIGTYTDNGGAYCGTQFTPSTGDGSGGLIREHSGVLNVMAFGAEPSATKPATSSTAAFTSAIDYLSANGGGKLLVPSGSWWANFTLKSGVVLVGEGIDSTIIRPFDLGPVVTWDRHLQYFGMRDIYILGDPTDSTCHGIYKPLYGDGTPADGAGVFQGDVSNIRIRECGGNGVHLVNGDYWEVTQFITFKDVMSAANVGNGWYTKGQVQNNVFIRCSGYNNTDGHGMHHEAYLSEGVYFTNTDNLYLKCQFELNYNGFGLYSEGRRNTYDRCWFEHNGNDAAGVISAGGSVGAYIEYPGAADGWGNNFRNCHFASHDVDLWLWQTKNNQISGNSFNFNGLLPTTKTACIKIGSIATNQHLYPDNQFYIPKDYGPWAASLPVNVGDTINNSLNTYTFECTVAGTTGGTEPVWNINNYGDATVDGTATWERRTIVIPAPTEKNVSHIPTHAPTVAQLLPFRTFTRAPAVGGEGLYSAYSADIKPETKFFLLPLQMSIDFANVAAGGHTATFKIVFYWNNGTTSEYEKSTTADGAYDLVASDMWTLMNGHDTHGLVKVVCQSKTDQPTGGSLVITLRMMGYEC